MTKLTTCCVSLCVGLLSPLSPARAEPVTISARFDGALGPNQYVVDFSSIGGETIFMDITGGDFELETDAAAGTARLVSWRQDVDPIEILPGLGTGPIEIAMEPGTATEGTYDPGTREFAVTATFLITFDDSELKEFGFVSPMPLLGTERGNIYGGTAGSIRMFLEGEGTAAGQPFAYTCQTTAAWEYVLAEDQAMTGDVTRDRAIDISDPVAILGALFLGQEAPCMEAADANADRAVDLSDAVHILAYLFRGGPATPEEPVTCGSGT